jgi:hypothetical protein
MQAEYHHISWMITLWGAAQHQQPEESRRHMITDSAVPHKTGRTCTLSTVLALSAVQQMNDHRHLRRASQRSKLQSCTTAPAKKQKKIRIVQEGKRISR